MERIVLASGSPARKRLLEELGISFEAKPSDIDEDNHPELDPPKRVAVLARLKAQKCHAENPGAWIIAGDSVIVAHDGTLLEKPKDAADAERMLRLQSGTWSTDFASICLISPDGELFEGVNEGKVLFYELSEETIAWWISTDIWKGKSGAFEIMQHGQLLLKSIDGSVTGVIGFPLGLLADLFAKAGRPLQAFMQP